jgi:hypothetical protein
MAALTSEQRDELRRRFERDQSRVFAQMAVSSGAIRTAVDELDDYFTSKAAEINNQLSEPAKSGLTAPQKSWLVTNIIDVKYGA